MDIRVGQDALRRWAWMVFDDQGQLVGSGDNYREAGMAMEEALNHIELMERQAQRQKVDA